MGREGEGEEGWSLWGVGLLLPKARWMGVTLEGSDRRSASTFPIPVLDVGMYVPSFDPS